MVVHVLEIDPRIGRDTAVVTAHQVIECFALGPQYSAQT